MSPDVLALGVFAIVAAFLVPLLVSRIVADRGDGWVSLFFLRREPRWPDGIQEQQDVPWRWRGTEPKVDPAVPRRVSDQTDGEVIRPVLVERLRARIHVH